MHFSSFAATCGEDVVVDVASLQLTPTFANRLAVPAKLTFSAPLPAQPELFDGSGHKQPPRTAFECGGGLDEERFERVGQFHCGSSSIAESGAHDTRVGMVYFL